MKAETKGIQYSIAFIITLKKYSFFFIEKKILSKNSSQK